MVFIAVLMPYKPQISMRVKFLGMENDLVLVIETQLNTYTGNNPNW